MIDGVVRILLAADPELALLTVVGALGVTAAAVLLEDAWRAGA